MTSKEYIDSGILEQYVLGMVTPDECSEVERRATADPAVRQEINVISESLEEYAMSHAIAPNPVIKPDELL